MLSFYKKYLIIAVLIHLSIALVSGSAYATLITLDGRDDAGIYPGQGAFAKFKLSAGSYVEVIPPYGPEWLTKMDVFTYASSLPWLRLQSAGNIWSSDTSVGDSYSVPSAGTYRISPVSGAYMYDAFGWGGYENKYWWKVYVGVSYNDQFEDHGYILGPDGVNDLDLDTLYATEGAYDSYALNSGTYFFNAYDNAGDAFNAVKNRYIDIPMAAGGTLSFWIWDWNSIDNSGSLSFNVTPVPEPSTFILLAIGFSCLLLRKGMGTINWLSRGK
jgi:hypothetical protein